VNLRHFQTQLFARALAFPAMVLVVGLVLGGCAEARPAAAPAGAYYGNASTRPAEAEARVASADDRFEASGDDDGVPSPPPPRPVRQIDRDGDAPTVTKKQIDRTPGTGTDDTTGGGGSGGGTAGDAGNARAQSPVTAEVHGTEYLIYTAHVTMAVYQVAPGLDAVERIGRDFGGYLSVKTDREVTIRIPRAKFDDALARVEASGDVLHRDVRAQDVTDEFMDLDTRLKNARAMRQRLQDLLAKAAVKEALEIETQLGRVTEAIETMEGKLKLLRDRIAFSTITVTFEARGQAAVRDMPLRLPFPWLSNMGLQRLLSLY
jgi:hypothetical protein